MKKKDDDVQLPLFVEAEEGKPYLEDKYVEKLQKLIDKKGMKKAAEYIGYSTSVLYDALHGEACKKGSLKSANHFRDKLSVSKFISKPTMTDYERRRVQMALVGMTRTQFCTLADIGLSALHRAKSGAPVSSTTIRKIMSAANRLLNDSKVSESPVSETRLVVPTPEEDGRIPVTVTLSFTKEELVQIAVKTLERGKSINQLFMELIK